MEAHDDGKDVSEQLAEQIQNEENQMDTGENKEEQKQEEGQPISGYVNQEQANTLMEMGFSKIVAEKALFMNMGVAGDPISMALEWIDKHSEDADFHEELKIVG